MADEVRDAYDGLAELYTKLALDDLDRETPDRAWLATFTELAREHQGVVADLGCGPGHVVDHLSSLGVPAVGYDLTPGLIDQARRAFPDAEFHVADLAALDIADSALAGIVARYSLIHLAPTLLAGIFADWLSLLAPDAPVLISFFAAPTSETHGTPFDHAVATAYQLFPATIVRQLQAAGFDRIETGLRGPLDFERALDHATVLARRPGS